MHTTERAHTLQYLFHPIPIGLAVIAITGQKVRFLYIGEEEESLLHLLRSACPNKHLSPLAESESSTYREWLKLLVHPTQKELHIAIEPRGTPFQESVWRYLLTIPRGEVRSYSDVAKGIGNERATRAVANACGRNPISLAIPCHRVVREGGTLGGYRWGIEKKQWLLDHERR